MPSVKPTSSTKTPLHLCDILPRSHLGNPCQATKLELQQLFAPGGLDRGRHGIAQVSPRLRQQAVAVAFARKRFPALRRISCTAMGKLEKFLSELTLLKETPLQILAVSRVGHMVDHHTVSDKPRSHSMCRAVRPLQLDTAVVPLPLDVRSHTKLGPEIAPNCLRYPSL